MPGRRTASPSPARTSFGWFRCTSVGHRHQGGWTAEAEEQTGQSKKPAATDQKTRHQSSVLEQDRTWGRHWRCSSLPDPSADAPADSHTTCWRAGASSKCCRMLHAAGGWPISTDSNADEASMVARNAVDRDRVCRGPVWMAGHDWLSWWEPS